MAEQHYHFPKDESGGYRWHIQQKVEIAIGRSFRSINDNEFGQTLLVFDPPLTPEELILIEAIFEGSNAQAAPLVAVDQKYVITDIYYSSFRDNLAAELGCDVHLWYTKSSPELQNSDLIEIHCSKLLSVQDKKKVRNAVDALMVGWV